MDAVQPQPAPIPQSSKPKRIRIPTPAAIWRYINIHWRYPLAEKRDLRLDLLRGFAVFVMVVDHFGGSSWLYYITGNNNFFTSGAEAFVLISGMVVGMVYGAIAQREGIKAAALKAFQRAFTLYKLTVVMTLVFAVASDLFNLPWKATDITDPIAFTLRVIFLRETYYLADIPMMYTFLMFMAPAGLYLLYKKRTALLIVLSFGGWVFYQYLTTRPTPLWPVIGNTTFHVVAWQLIFFWAMAMGYHRDALWQKWQALPRLPYFLFATALFIWLVHLYTTEIKTLERLYPGVDIAGIVAELFNKADVGPGRLLATAITFQFAYLLTTYFWTPIKALFGWMLTPLGSNSLYSYTMHVIIIGLFYIALPLLPGHITQNGILNTSLQLSVLLALWLMIRRQFAFDVIPR